jgi:adenine-specific DNA-methyltransferase
MSDPSSTPETLNDLLPITPDIRAERLAELKRLFPDLFTNEGRLNPDELRQLVEPNEVHETERYEFKWYGKAASKREAFTPTTATLVYDEARSVNPDKADGNMIIEGENLETLKLLLNAYREQVKCIYIDPPYNTGKDFIYRDNYAKDRKSYWDESGSAEDGVKLESNPETSGRYHSDWLSMMQARLLVARSLLKDDGLIFVSCDDHEAFHLRKIMNDLFGEENHVETIIWKKSYGGGAKSKYLVNLHEYIICFAKDLSTIPEISLPPDPEALKYYKQQDDKFHIRGPYRHQPLATNSMDDRPNLRYPIIWEGEEILPEKQWQWSKERVDAALENNEIVARKNTDGSWTVDYKQYLRDENGNERRAKLYSLQEGPYTQRGTKELETVLEQGGVFDFPKPLGLLEKILSVTEEGDIVLDFFAGSGVTAHALLNLEIETGKRRHFILAQIPETTSDESKASRLGFAAISAITIERVKRVIEGYGDNPQPMPDAGFKVYKLQKSNFPRCDFKPDPAMDEEANVAALRRYIDEKEAAFFLTLDEQGEQAVFDEVLLKNGFQLHYTRDRREDFTDNTVFEVRDPRRTALVCLAWNESIKDSTIKRLREIADGGEIPFFICLERSLSTTSKWNLRHFLGKHFNAF